MLQVGLVLTAGAMGALILLRARRERVVAAAVLVGAVVTVLLPTPYL